jgi:hypothetical protein
MSTIAGFVTREQAKLRKPRSVSRNINPERGGVVGHWGGPSQRGAGVGHSHAMCLATWQMWQRVHMVDNDWVDIAYTMGVCNHGFVFAGRGEGVRTAAQGSGNQNHYAVVWIGGSGQKPTQLALNAFDWCLNTLRKAGAGRRVRSHQDFMSTTCAGNDITRHARTRDNKNVPSAASSGPRLLRLEDPFQRGNDVRAWQQDLNRWSDRVGETKVTVDGFFGPQTAAATSKFMSAVMGVQTNDPRVGPKSLKAMADALAAKSPDQMLKEVVVVLRDDVDLLAEVHDQVVD